MSVKVRSFSGKVVKLPWAVGSKSDHVAVCLETGKQRLKLRRLGGNAFFDPELEKLVGKSIKAKGQILPGSTVLISQWAEI